MTNLYSLGLNETREDVDDDSKSYKRNYSYTFTKDQHDQLMN